MASEETAQLIAKEDSGKEVENNVDVALQPKPKKTGNLVQFCRLFSNIPLSVYFIVGNEFCERFAYYGMRAVLVLYLVFQLDLTEDSATAVFHLYTFLAYFMPIFGSMIADSYIGKFWTILVFSLIYAVGCISISLSAIPCILGYITQVRLGLCFLGLILIAFGTGGIKPCVSAFGGDQVNTGDKSLLPTFFSLFYFSINAGSLISIFITPILRRDLQCFDADCYAASFGVPAVLMISSILVFLAGSYLYVRVPPTGRNVYIRIFSIIFYAIYERIRQRGSSLKKKHWLDWAVPKYDPSVVLGVKAIVKVFIMLLPLPIFWALFDQQGSRWLLQVARMDTSLFGILSVHPDQVQIVNPILILVFIPIFDKILYPLVGKCGIKVTTLRKMTCGIFLAGIAFILSALVQIQIENGADRSAPDGDAFLKIFNPTSLQANFSISNNSDILLNSTVPSHQFAITQLEAARYQLSFKINESGSIASYVYDVNLNSTLTCSVLLSNSSTVKPYCINMNEAVPVVTKYQASIQYVNSLSEQTTFYIQDNVKNRIYCNGSVPALGMSDFCKIPTGDFLLKFKNSSKEFSVLNGDVYSLLAYSSGDGNDTVQQYLDVKRSVSFLWQVPMYVVMTVGEVMFSISGLEFAYSQSPTSMKSVMQGMWLLTVAFGNLLVFIISQFELFSSQVVEFFFFAFAAIIISILFGFMSYFYKYMVYDEVEPQFASSTTVRKTFTESQRLAEKID